MITAEIKTKVVGTEIHQETKIADDLRGTCTSWYKQIVATQERQIKEALISLGWKPPHDN